MGELKNTIDNMASRLKENAKIIGGQTERIEYWIREFEALAGKIEKVDDENIQLKKQLEEQGKELEKTVKEKDALAKQQK